ncbi:MAG: carboxypeptidase-like regulatory domain-containing protein [Nitrospirota bacterium]
MFCLRDKIIVLLLFLIAGCITQGHPIDSRSKEDGLLTGTVTFTGVPCPPDRMRVPPCDGPYPNYEVLIYKEDGKTIFARTLTDRDGIFKIRLPLGRYIIYSKQFNSVSKTTEVPNLIKLEAGKTTHININIDTGIR